MYGLTDIKDTLTKLDLRSNPLLGNIPSETWLGFQTMVHLDLRSTGMTTFPNLTDMWPTLQYLYVGSNPLKGNFISALGLLGNHQKLKLLDLNNIGLVAFPDLAYFQPSTVNTF